MFAAEVYLNPSFDLDLSFDIKYKAPSMTTGIAIWAISINKYFNSVQNDNNPFQAYG